MQSGFRVAYWDDQGLWESVRRLISTNLPLHALSVQLPSSIVVSSRSSSIQGHPHLREVYLPKVHILCLPSTHSSIMPKQQGESIQMQPASPDSIHSGDVISSVGSIGSPNGVIEAKAGDWDGSLMSWLESGPDICVNTDGSDIPVAHLYLFTCDSVEFYKANLRTNIKKWAEKMGELGDEFLLLFLAPQDPGPSKESVSKLQKKLFEKIKTDLITSIDSALATNIVMVTQNSSRNNVNKVRSVKDRVLRLPVCPMTETDSNNVLPSGWKGIPTADPAFVEMWETFFSRFSKAVSCGLASRIQAEVTQKELQQSAGSAGKSVRAKYTIVFEATERLAGSLVRCQMYPEALSVYDSLDLRMADQSTTAKRYRTLFHVCGLPALGSNPVLFDIDRKVLRRSIQTDSISYVDFRQYLFGRQAQVLYRMGRVDKLCVRSLAFVNSFGLELLSFAYGSSKEDCHQLREASVRAFLLLLTHNLLVRLLFLGYTQAQDISGVSPVQEITCKHILNNLLAFFHMSSDEAQGENEQQALISGSVKFQSSASRASLGRAGTNNRKQNAFKRGALTALHVTGQLEALALQNLWWLLKWRAIDNWRVLTTVPVPDDPPDWESMIMRPLTTFDLGRMLSSLSASMGAEESLWKQTVRLLEANNFYRQSMNITMRHTRFRWYMGDPFRVSSEMPALDPHAPMPRDFAAISKEGNINSLSFWVVQLLKAIPEESRKFPALLLSWLLLNRRLNSSFRHILIKDHLEGIEPFKRALSSTSSAARSPNASLSLTALHMTFTAEDFFAILAAIGYPRKSVLSSQRSAAIVSFKRKLLSSRSSFIMGEEQLPSERFSEHRTSGSNFVTWPIPAAPNIQVSINVVNSNQHSVLQGFSDTENSQDFTIFDTLELCMQDLSNASIADAGTVASFVVPVQTTGTRGGRHDGSMSRTVPSSGAKSAEEVASRGSPVVKHSVSGNGLTPRGASPVVKFAEPLTVQLLLDSELTVPIAIHKLWLKIDIESRGDRTVGLMGIDSPPGTTKSSKAQSGAKASTPMALDDQTLWICTIPASEEQGAFLLHPGLNLVQIRWNPTRGGRLVFSEVFIIPQEYQGFFLYQSLCLKRTQRRDLRAAAIFKAVNSKSLSIPLPLKPLETAKQKFLDVQSTKFVLNCNFSILALSDATGAQAGLGRSLPVILGQMNILRIAINVCNHVKVVTASKLALHLKWLSRQKSDKEATKQLKATVVWSHVVATDIDGKNVGLSKQPNGRLGINPTYRCIPSGGSHDWLGLPKFESSIVILVPIQINQVCEEQILDVPSGPSPSPTSSLSPGVEATSRSTKYLPVREITDSNRLSDAASIEESQSLPKRSGSLPRLNLGRRSTVAATSPITGPRTSSGQKEASVLVPRHVRSPSVRASLDRTQLHLRMARLLPLKDPMLPAPSAPAAERRAQLQVFARVRAAVAPISAANATHSASPFKLRLRTVDAKEGLPLVVSEVHQNVVCLEKSTSPPSSFSFPRIEDLAGEQSFLAEQTQSSIFDLESMFRSRFLIRSTDTGMSVYNLQIEVSASNSKSTSAVPEISVEPTTSPTEVSEKLPSAPSKLRLSRSMTEAFSPQASETPDVSPSLDRAATMRKMVEEFRLDFCEMEVGAVLSEPKRPPSFTIKILIENGLHVLNPASRSQQTFKLHTKDVRPGQLYSIGIIVQYSSTPECYKDLTLDQWLRSPGDTLKFRLKYNICRRNSHQDSLAFVMEEFLKPHNADNYWFQMAPLEVPSRPSPITLIGLEIPKVGVCGDIVQVNMVFQNFTQYHGFVRYNVFLPFDIDVDEDRETLPVHDPASSLLVVDKFITPKARCWQLVGFKCTTVELAPTSVSTISLRLVPTIAGCLPLPPIRLLAWLGGEKKRQNYVASIPMHHCERQISVQRVFVKGGGLQKLPLQLLP